MNPAIWDGKMYPRGWKKSQNGTAQVTDKSTREILATIANASATEIREASSVAVTAGSEWARVSSEKRASIVRRAGEILDQYSEEVVYWLIRESGSPRLKAILEVQAANEYLYHAADLAVPPTMKVLKNDDDMLSSIERVPLGVVGVIGPFNFPLALALRSLAAALAMGNAVVLKPSLNTAVSGGVIVARVFEEACLPEGVLQVLPGGDEAGTALTDDPHVSIIAFTGSTAVGRKIGMTAGSTLKRMSLELGGKNPFLVLPDADL
jgi:benzaldehyde dehydrogenase (NAD)